MKTSDGSIKRFKKEPKYVHNRSEGLTRRKNKGSQFVIDTKKGNQ